MDRASGWPSPVFDVGRMRERAERLGRWLLAVVILVSALGLGALHTQVLAAVAVLASLATGLLWWNAEPLDPRPAATALVGTALLLVVWTVVQIVPLPMPLLRLFAPDNADVWSRCLSALQQPGPTFATISLEPVASRVQILRGLTYLVVFVGALRVARKQEGVAFLERALLVSTVTVAGVAAVHPVLGAHKVFGVYEPHDTLAYDVNHIGPLLNMNHLAAYADIGVILAFGSVIVRRTTLPRPPALAIVLILAATTAWTLSRGGIAAMVLGVVLATLLTFGSRRTRRARIAGQIAVAFVGVFGGIMLVLGMFEDAVEKFISDDLSKVDLVLNSFKLVPAHPLFGIGRGAFEATFQKQRTGVGYWVFTHPEDVVAQWITEWGVPVSIVALVAIGWALRPRTALARSRPPVGPWAALIAVAVQNLVDFNSEVPGVIIALATCAAMVTGGSGGAGPVRHRGSRWASRPNLLVKVLGVATLVAVAATLPFVSHELNDEQRAFHDVGLDTSLSLEQFHTRAATAMSRHPADPYFPFIGAVRASVVRDESVIPWAARVLERSPVHGRVHLLLARSLFARNPSQARLEYRTACAQDVQVCAPAEAMRLVGGYEDAMDLVPDGPQGLPMLQNLTSSLASRLPATVVRLDAEIAARDPSALEPVARAAARSLGDARDGESWCVDSKDTGTGRAGCIAEGLEATARLRAAAPERCEGHALAAELHAAAGDGDTAFTDFEGALEEVTERSVCTRRLVSLALRSGNSARIDSTLDRLLKLGCEAPSECVENLTFAADIETQRGGLRRALALMKKASDRAPERDELLANVASRAEQQGAHGEALDAYTKLAERHPDVPQWAKSAAREREAVQRNVFQHR